MVVKDSYIKKIDLKHYFSDTDLADFAALPVSRNEDYVLGRIALKHAYHKSSDFPSIRVVYSSSGVPMISGEKDLYCSISHSYGTGVAAIASYKIGVDIEKTRSHNPNLLDYISTPDELKLFGIDDKNVLVTYVWVIKEAVAKAIGKGIAYPFKKMTIQKAGNNYKVLAEKIDWVIEVIAIDNYIMSISRSADETGEIDLNYLQ